MRTSGIYHKGSRITTKWKSHSALSATSVVYWIVLKLALTKSENTGDELKINNCR